MSMLNIELRTMAGRMNNTKSPTRAEKYRLVVESLKNDIARKKEQIADAEKRYAEKVAETKAAALAEEFEAAKAERLKELATQLIRTLSEEITGCPKSGTRSKSTTAKNRPARAVTPSVSRSVPDLRPLQDKLDSRRASGSRRLVSSSSGSVSRI
jgi:hypothetical protein